MAAHVGPTAFESWPEFGGVFYGSFAHSSATWDIRDVQQMYLEAIKWSLGLTSGDVKPHAVSRFERAIALDPRFAEGY